MKWIITIASMVCSLATAATFNGQQVTQSTNAQGQIILTPVAGSVETPGVLSTNTPSNFLQFAGASSSVQQLFSDASSVFYDAQPYITNDIVQFDAGILYNKAMASGSKLGGFADVNIPTTQQLAIGFGGAYIGRQWLDATVNIKLGTTWSWPLIGKVYAWVAEGPDYNFQSKGIGAYSFAGVTKGWDVYTGSKGQHLMLSADVGVGDVSTFAGTDILLGLSVNYHY
jgi:hypothetical protein